MKLSVCMIVKNEEKYLDKCLFSLNPIRDKLPVEIIIVDTGSTDNTVNIARKYTDKVYFHEWNNDFADMRNKSIKYAKGEWLLILDGDEIIEKPEGIINFLNSSNSKKYNSALLRLKSITSDRNKESVVVANVLRMFKNNDFYYTGVVHEQPNFKLPTCSIDAEIVHYGYLSTDKNLMEYKFNRNLSLLKKEIEKDPENVYYWFQLSQTYGMHNDLDLALDAILKAYDLAKKKNLDLRSRMYIHGQMAIVYFNKKDYQKLQEVCNEAILLKDDMIDFYYYSGVAQSIQKKFDEAIESYQKYINLIETQTYYMDPSVHNFTLEKYEFAYASLGELYYNKENYEKSLYYLNKVSSQEYLNNVIIYKIKIYIKQKEYETLLSYYKEIKDQKNNNEKLLKTFWMILDRELSSLEDDEKYKLIELFSNNDDIYSLINKIRLNIKNNIFTIDEEMMNKITEADFETMPASFGDILYYLARNKISLTDIVGNVNINILESLLFNIKDRDGFIDVMTNYLASHGEHKDLANLRINKIIEKNILLTDKLDSDSYDDMWNKYINDGILYTTYVYSPQIINSESLCDVRINEDLFFLYIKKALDIRDRDKVQYVKYLRKALKAFPSMKKGIELMTEEIEKIINSEKEKEKQINDEFNALKKAVKGNIKILLEARKYIEAEAIINEYLSIVPDDAEMKMLKSQIQSRTLV